MQVKRFVAADMRRALELVRQELGPDAIILSNKRVPEGVELVTTLPADADPNPLSSLVSAPVPEVTEPTGLASGKTGQQLADEIEQARQRMLASRKAEASAKEFLMNRPVRPPVVRADAFDQPASSSRSAAERYGLDTAPVTAPVIAKQAARKPSPQVPAESSTQLAELQAELADMRLLLEQQLDRLIDRREQPQSPVLASVGRRLERLGLPADQVTPVLRRCASASTLTGAWPEALASLAHQLPVTERDVVAQGGIFAFVGPTGAGKTTTIGKLAARYVLERGADKVALVTMDTFRIAAHDQLRSMARILRVPVRVVDENNSLASVLRSLRRCELVLIDTAGFRHGDPQLKEQLDTLAAQPQVRNYLVLSSNSQQQMLKASVHAYGSAGLEGCILTKLDETASLGEAMGVALQSRLPIAYTTDGQDIPKDIDVARAHKLVARAAALLKQQSQPGAATTRYHGSR